MAEHWGYTRVSTTKESQAASWDDQVAQLRKLGCTTIKQEEASAGGPRPVFERMVDEAIDRAEATASAVYIHVTKLDRAFRDLEQALRTIRKTPKHNVFWVLHDISQAPLDPKDPAQSLLVTVMAAIGQFEKDRFAERRAVGIAKAKQEGRYKGRAPTAQGKASEVTTLRARGFKIAEIVKQTGVSQASVYRILLDARAADAATA